LQRAGHAFVTRQIAIVTPVLDDWTSFASLIAEISGRFSGADVAFHVCALDDGSIAPLDGKRLSLPADSCIANIEIIRLAANLGHQRAIAVGLCAIAERDDIDAVLVMDSDGEDRPADIAALIAEGERQSDHVVFARRVKRSESRAFRFGYLVYRHLFHALTGQAISFGNYVLMPKAAVERLVHMPELWNNLAAAIMRSRLGYASVPTERGTRYAGRSRMRFAGLVVHGLSAISVYGDVVFVRIMMATAVIALLSVAGIIGITAVRFASNLAIPGWATAAAGNLLIVLLQTVVIMVATTLTMLAGRSARPIVPIVDCKLFIARRQQCWIRPASIQPVLMRAVR
jgi:polyisoprenyl-phosphate glycosyltransferase